MLEFPDRGLRRSVNRHNVSIDAMCDWLEASLLFSEFDEISASEIIDRLIADNFYDDQDFAWEIVGQLFEQSRLRLDSMGDARPFEFESRTVRRTRSWLETPEYSFCLILALPAIYRAFSTAERRSDYTVQGEMFERLTAESFQAQFDNWQIHHTGWSASNTNNIQGLVRRIAELLGEPIGSVERWTRPAANEAGLDLLIYQPFNDNRVGIPVYLMQCASGEGWEDKVHTPVLRIWAKIIDFAASPRKAFAMPFALIDSEFVRICNLVDGMLMDRPRILAAYGAQEAWVSNDLRSEIVDWLHPRVERLPIFQD